MAGKEKVKFKSVPTGIYSATEYADLAGVSSSAVRLRASAGTLPEGVRADKLGSTYVITVTQCDS